MKGLSRLFFLITFFLMLFLGCTDVPISYSSIIPNIKLAGFWETKDKNSGGLLIEKVDDGTTLLTQYETDSITKKLKFHESNQIYFATLKDKQGSLNFFSYGNKTDGFNTFKYSFNANNELTLSGILDDSFEKYFEKIDSKITFKTPEKFSSFLELQMRNPSIYGKSEKLTKNKQFVKPNIITNDETPQTLQTPKKELKRNGSYGLFKWQSRKYIRELRTWDDFSGWADIDETKNSAKFFENGFRLTLDNKGSQYILYGTNLNYVGTVKSVVGLSTFYKYSGWAKQNGVTIGNFILYISDATYKDLQTGTYDDYRFDILVDFSLSDMAENGFWGTLINGADKIEWNFRGNTQ